ncbi:MAG: hypothetical protein GY814_03075 [Gammaproteobacteria bacterium]|nr:hypothetical protein [Gammaproteobacteria bacterium]
MAKPGLLLVLLACLPFALAAQDTIELQTTTIKGNKELPKILFIVPWKEVAPAKLNQQELVLHSLSDDLFDPVLPVQY